MNKDLSFFVNFDDEGGFALRTQDFIRTGKSRIVEGELCLKSPSMILGRWMCGPVFRDTRESNTDPYDYVYAFGNWLFEFRVLE